MYVFTRDGLVAIAHYDPEMNNHEGWLEDGIRREIHQSSVNGEDNFVVRGWHPTLIAEVLGMKVNGVGQSVFYDDQADYPYRGLVKGDDMPLVFEHLMSKVDYYSLKASVLNTDQQMWNGLNAVHQTAKHAFDTRYFPFNASYLNDGFAVVWDEWEQDQ